MKFKTNKENMFLYLLFTLFTLFTSYFISIRDLSLVDDNLIYAQNFIYKLSINNFHYEFLFDLLTFVVRLFTDSYIVYFFILNIVLNLILLFLSKKISELEKINKVYFSFLFFSFLCMSSWYQVAAANGLRQGLSLALLYLFFVYLVFNINKFYSFLFLLGSILFHYSSILIIPFIFLIKLNLNKLFFLLNILGIFYILGVNEKIVYIISSVLGISLYDSIKNYVEDTNSYRYGFQWDLFLYSLALAYIYFFFSKYFIKSEGLYGLVKIYFLLLMPYFIFGFAGFSNRYGLFAWFFSILLNTLIFYYIFSKSKSFFPIGIFVTFAISFSYFSLVYGII
ncbi:EpsG family protein [Acinetobacter variabilis]|uniref:EpsG family protein n=1 Tax=Acinetobacter variabilis TaxID=70346 RepID=UPI0030F9FA30